MNAIVCPECGETLAVNPEDVQVAAYLVCEGCYATLEVVSEDPVEVLVVEIDPDDLEEDDAFEDEDD